MSDDYLEELERKNSALCVEIAKLREINAELLEALRKTQLMIYPHASRKEFDEIIAKAEGK